MYIGVEIVVIEIGGEIGGKFQLEFRVQRRVRVRRVEGELELLEFLS
jgi:hypothetical protein